MKTVFSMILLLMLLKADCCFGQLTGKAFNGMTIYLVRHAERDTGNNPSLTRAGFERAGDLWHYLVNKHIDMIFETQYRRAQQTGDSIRIYEGIDSVLYKADTTAESLFSKIKQYPGLKNILVIGHSNTIPAIIRRLGVINFTLKEIPDNEFSNIYIVTILENHVTLKQEQFGKTSSNTEPAKMKPLE